MKKEVRKFSTLTLFNLDPEVVFHVTFKTALLFIPLNRCTLKQKKLSDFLMSFSCRQMKRSSSLFILGVYQTSVSLLENHLDDSQPAIPGQQKLSKAIELSNYDFVFWCSYDLVLHLLCSDMKGRVLRV
jgi:hypothetical protein